ncbi:MAG: hypothetical protein RIC35_15765 [Marinoscillum sp.]
MKVDILFLLIVIALATTSCDGVAQPSAPDQINQQWASNSLWDDGKAEVAIYNAERIVYGEPRQFEYVYVLVKETFNEAFHVKTDDYERNDLYAVMKVNKFCRIETLKYPYHYLTSVFFRRENPTQVHKLTNTSQEWCGNTAKSFLEKGNKYEFQYMSYWDGQGNGITKIDKSPWFEDQLSYTLRALKFEDGLEFEVEMYPSQVSSIAAVPKSESASITVSKAEKSELANLDSTFISNPWKISISRADGPDLTYWINGDYPNTLLKMESTDGRKLSLKSLERDAYWAYE